MTKQLRPLMLGIVGDSAAGKTTISSGISQIIGDEDVTAICLDDYHKYDRLRRKEVGISALHPDCNYVDIMEQHVNLLRLGQPILKPVYNHDNGMLERPEYVKPKKLVIVEGLLCLLTPALQRSLDITVYLDPDERLRRSWKVTRDTAKRSYTQEQVLASLLKRTNDSEQFIHPQKKAADLIVRFWPPYGYFDDTVDNAQLNIRLFQRHSLPRLDLREELEHARNGEKTVLRQEKDVWSGGQPVDILDIDGTISHEKAEELAGVIWDHLAISGHARPKVLGDFSEGKIKRHSEPLALTQLMITSYLLKVREHRPVETD
ncbi:MAG TPA: phosphoribulokinase [Anaerolineales bacterium]|nr:phosphoribulokinase [Anaerolineales bacterium]